MWATFYPRLPFNLTLTAAGSEEKSVVTQEKMVFLNQVFLSAAFVCRLGVLAEQIFRL